MSNDPNNSATFQQIATVMAIIGQEGKDQPKPPPYPVSAETLDFATGKVKPRESQS
jgi:hypothetical protein